MADFAGVFKMLRSEKGLSQQELADRLKISKSSVNMYERGERQPNFETLETIADYFNVHIDFLLGRSSSTNNVFNPHTTAAHLKTDTLTQDELDDVADYIEYIKNKRKK